ncbi:MAG TPA: VWA domain-containing protein [Porticoccus sp.]|nr:VWA domain-containing protein [Porticoccus sp.]
MNCLTRILLLLLLPFFTVNTSAKTVDLIFVLDASGSVGQNNWETQNEFVSELIRRLPGEDYNIGLISFSTNAIVRHSLSDHQSYESISSALTNMPYSGGSTNHRDAINTALDMHESFNSGNDLFMAMFTDGTSYPVSSGSVCQRNFSAGIATRNRFLNSGAEPLIYAVGSAINTATIDCITTNPDAEIVHVSDYQEHRLLATSGLFYAAIDPENYSGSPIDYDGFEGACISSGYNYIEGECFISSASTVPVPTAAWLFGSALVGVVGLKRKK